MPKPLKALNTYQLLALADHVGVPNFRGVFTAHQLPTGVAQSPYCFISNSHTYRGGGEHWTSFWITSQRPSFFFDSFGRSPSALGHYDWKVYLQTHGYEDFNFNQQVIQDTDSEACGYLSLRFLMLKGKQRLVEPYGQDTHSQAIINSGAVHVDIREWGHRMIQEMKDLHNEHFIDF